VPNPIARPMRVLAATFGWWTRGLRAQMQGKCAAGTNGGTLRTSGNRGRDPGQWTAYINAPAAPKRPGAGTGGMSSYAAQA
jgi:hypothetical protein